MLSRRSAPTAASTATQARTAATFSFVRSRSDAADGARAVALIVDVSERGLAPKNDPALYALATAISLGDQATRRAAAEALPRVARIGTHLFHFVAYAQTMRGWGRTLRWAVANWYDRNPEQLALQAVKYRQRDGWSHRDLLRLAHPKGSDDLAGLFGWIVDPQNERVPEDERVDPSDWKLPDIVRAFALAQEAATPARTAQLVREYGLPREALLTDHLTSREVWEALLEAGMPTTAMLRNLATMTRVGALDSTDHLATVVDRLGDQDAIRAARVHPMAVLLALSTYAAGHGMRGQNVWQPKVAVVDALDEAFYLAFDNVEPTGKRILLALDVSGSMASPIAGSPLSAREASVAMALVTLHAEEHVDVMGFTGGFVPLPISRRQRLDDAVRAVSDLGFERTDCAQPMLYASRERKLYDAFVVYTDSEMWAGGTHPAQALDAYRRQFVAGARSAVVGMASNGFTIADPNDAGMLDFVGFDASAPQLIGEFVAGKV